jgi:hypothetical protein
VTTTAESALIGPAGTAELHRDYGRRKVIDRHAVGH